MIESTTQTQNQAPIAPPQKVLKMVKNERMGGLVPSWEVPKTAKDNISANLSGAINADKNQSFENALALQSDGSHASNANADEFGFGDLFDIVNPLHHIPLVGTAYRELTGDNIKPIGKIIGGGLFGGGLGAASGLVNVVVESETGSDITGNAVNLALRGQKPQFKSINHDPKTSIGQALDHAENPHDELPASLLAFTDQGTNYKSLNLERLSKADNLAGELPARESITSFEIQQKVPFREL